jgi:hypothetical protein
MGGLLAHHNNKITFSNESYKGNWGKMPAYIALVGRLKRTQKNKGYKNMKIMPYLG